MMFRRLASDQRGATAIYVALGMGVIFGAGGLAIDLARAMSLETELQHAADAAALAGAAELTGEDGARDRARAAATGAFGTNLQTFASDAGGSQVVINSVAFLSALEDPVAKTADKTAINDAEARFIKVTVAPRESRPLLMPVLTRNDTALKLGATATAGFNRVACKIPPLMVCNPFEPSPAPAHETGFDSLPGEQVLIKSHTGPQGGQWAPGTFGLLDTPDGNQSTQQLAIWMAKGTSPGCYSTKLSVRPGQADAIRSALNVRFDMYENPFFGGSSKSDPAFAPALNVTKGLVVPVPSKGKADPCAPEPPALPGEAMALPRDSCIKAQSCRFGAGDWDRAGYWTVNHGMAPPAGVTTRYQTYRWEIDNSKIPDPDPTTGSTKEVGSSGNPDQRCYSGPVPPSDTPDRRVLHFAVVNCGYHDVRGNAKDIRPVAFVKAFLTEPVSTSSDIYLETIEVAKPDVDTSVMHDVIQLYR